MIKNELKEIANISPMYLARSPVSIVSASQFIALALGPGFAREVCFGRLNPMDSSLLSTIGSDLTKSSLGVLVFWRRALMANRIMSVILWMQKKVQKLASKWLRVKVRILCFSSAVDIVRATVSAPTMAVKINVKFFSRSAASAPGMNSTNCFR